MRGPVGMKPKNSDLVTSGDVQTDLSSLRCLEMVVANPLKLPLDSVCPRQQVVGLIL